MNYNKNYDNIVRRSEATWTETQYQTLCVSLSVKYRTIPCVVTVTATGDFRVN